jgi:hypothetical protein
MPYAIRERQRLRSDMATTADKSAAANLRPAGSAEFVEGSPT